MASPCEVHVGGADRATAERIVALAAGEAARIEAKFSRYRRGNVIDAINTAQGRTVTLDDETARLLDYAAQLYELERRQIRRDVGRAAPRVAIRRQRSRSEPQGRRRVAADRRLGQGPLACTANHAAPRHGNRSRRNRQGVRRRSCGGARAPAVDALLAEFRRRPARARPASRTASRGASASNRCRGAHCGATHRARHGRARDERRRAPLIC